MMSVERAYIEEVNDPTLGFSPNQKEAIIKMIRLYEYLVKHMQILIDAHERSVIEAKELIFILSDGEFNLNSTLH